MVQNERMAGSIPKWERISDMSEPDTKSLQLTETPKDNEQAIAFNSTEKASKDDPFTFGDFIDMVNPLQHIPIVSHFYREFTGDQIKPVSNIIGGAVFGGPLGAVGGLVNSVAGYALEQKNTPAIEAESSGMAVANTNTTQTKRSMTEDLPGTTLAFANLATDTSSEMKETSVTEKKTAARDPVQDYPFMPKVPITELFWTADPGPIISKNKEKRS